LKTSGPEHHSVFAYPEKFAENRLISMAATVDPSLMASWSNRADLVVSQGDLYAIFYKKYPPTIGFVNGAQWFEEELRSLHRP